MEYLNGKIIVEFHNNVSADEKKEIVQGLGLSTRSNMILCTLQIKVPVGSEQEWVEKFEKLPSVLHAERRVMVPPPDFHKKTR